MSEEQYTSTDVFRLMINLMFFTTICGAYLITSIFHADGIVTSSVQSRISGEAIVCSYLVDWQDEHCVMVKQEACNKNINSISIMGIGYNNKCVQFECGIYCNHSLNTALLILSTILVISEIILLVTFFKHICAECRNEDVYGENSTDTDDV